MGGEFPAQYGKAHEEEDYLKPERDDIDDLEIDPVFIEEILDGDTNRVDSSGHKSGGNKEGRRPKGKDQAT